MQNLPSLLNPILIKRLEQYLWDCSAAIDRVELWKNANVPVVARTGPLCPMILSISTVRLVKFHDCLSCLRAASAAPTLPSPCFPSPCCGPVQLLCERPCPSQLFLLSTYTVKLLHLVITIHKCNIIMEASFCHWISSTLLRCSAAAPQTSYHQVSKHDVVVST